MHHPFPNLRLPLIAAPMFLVSGPELVIACCESGIVGTFPALNQRSSEGFAAWLSTIRERLQGQDAAPYGVNLIVHPSNARLEADLALCVQHAVPLIITSLGAVPEVVKRVHAYGGRVFHDVIGRRHAEKAVAAGVDGLILVSAGAGGHAGTLSPFALLHEVRQFFDGPIVLAGALSTGADIAAAQMMGADYAYMGTRFIATQEAMASDAYKQMLVDSSAADIVYTPAISSVAANFLKPSLLAAGLDPAQLAAPEKVDLAHLTNPDLHGAKAWKDIWSAGHGVGSIHDAPPVATLAERLTAEYDAAIARFHTRPR